MIRKIGPDPILIALWLLGSSAVVSAQTTTSRPLDAGKTLNYAFVSPNTKENLTIDEAIKELNSAEELKLIKRIRDLACRTKSRPRVARALGSWSDGAEHTVLLQVTTDEATVRYLVSKLGEAASQKSVLYFHGLPSGTAQIYILRPRKQVRSLRTVANLLDQAGIAFRTLVPTKHGAMIYVVDLKGELRPKIVTARRRLNARLQIRSGAAGFIGHDNDRQKAKVVFNEEIKTYEANHPNLPPGCNSRRGSMLDH